MKSRPSLGLALGAGVARGWAHIGILKSLKRAGIEPDIVAGTSIGSVVAGCHLTGKLDDLEKWARSLTTWRVISYLDFRVASGGIIGGGKLKQELRSNLADTRIEDLPKPLRLMATDLTTGHEVWLREGDLVDAMAASYALPGIFPPVALQDRWLVDGALVNPIPVSVCRALGAQVIIACNLGADMIGRTQIGNSVPRAAGFDLLEELDKGATPGSGSRMDWLTKRIFGRPAGSPSMFGTMVSALAIVQDRIARSRLAGEPPDVHVTPRVGHIGMLEFQRASELIELGEAAMEAAMPELRDALAIANLHANGSSFRP